MKQSSILLAGVLILLASGCGGFNSDETPLNGNLVAFTARAKTSGDTLTGVKTIKGAVIVKPESYVSVAADENLIFCKKPNGRVNVCRHDGTVCGSYDTFTRKAVDDNVFYLGLCGDVTSYYFPMADPVETRQSYMARQHVFIEKDNAWQVYDYAGKKLWEMPEGALVVESIQTDALIIAVPEKGRHPRCHLYTPEGEKFQTLSRTRWESLQKQLSLPMEIGTLRFHRVILPKFVELTANPFNGDINLMRYNVITTKLLQYYA